MRWIALVLVGVVLLGLAGSLAFGGPGPRGMAAGSKMGNPGAPAGTPAPFRPNVRITDGSSPYLWQVEPTMVINASGTIFVGWKETDGPEAAGIRVGASYSTDGGGSWAPNILMNQSHPDQGCHNSDPWMALAPDDRVHYAYLEYDCPGTIRTGLDVSNTTNGGDWGQVHFVQGRGGLVDKDSIAFDRQGRLYATWDEGNVLAITWSDDGGSTWAPQLDPDDSPGGVLGAIVATAPNGTVYLTWWDFGSNNILFDWSGDRGNTWHRDVRVNDRAGSAVGSGWELPLPAMNVDANSGAIYIAWMDSRDGNHNIYFSSSTDGGKTWAANTRINDDSGGADQWMVDLAVDSRGTVHAAWEDDRLNGNHNIFYSNSTDGGATWSTNVRVSDEDTSGSYSRPGDYFAIEAGPDGTIYVVWTDGRGDDFDIYFARSPGLPTGTVTVATDPPGLKVAVDGTTQVSPVIAEWVIGSTHRVAAPSPQPAGPSARYNWTAWSDGGAPAHEVVVTGDMNLTARFQKQYLASLSTSPKGLRLLVDNTSYAGAASLWWDEGSVHWLEAPSPQEVGADVRYVWSSWSDGGDRAHAVTAAGPVTAQAAFQQEQTLRVDTEPGGLRFTLDGVAYPAPQVLWLPVGSSHTIAVDEIEEGSPGVRYRFLAWSDGGAATHVFGFDGTMALTASFATEYYLKVEAPVKGATGEGWYTAGSIARAGVPGTVIPTDPGTRLVFQAWGGDATGYGPLSDPIAMDGPKVAVAEFQTQYYLTVLSPYGTPGGTGWYAAGSPALATVDPGEVALAPGERLVVARWSGDATGAGATSNPILMDGPKVATAEWKRQVYLTIATPYGRALIEGWYDAGTAAVARLDASLVSLGPGRRAVFVGWSLDASGSDAAASAPIAMEGPRTAAALWRLEYELRVESAYGIAAGGGWYPAGAIAYASLDTGEVATGTGTKAVFLRWSGDATGSNPLLSDPIRMEGPKVATAEWVAQRVEVAPPLPSPALALLLAVVLIAAVAALVVQRRRRR